MSNILGFLRNSYDYIRQTLARESRKLVFTGIGKPASGKGRQAEILNDVGVASLRTSALLDRLPKTHPFNVARAKGELSPGMEVAKMVMDDIFERDCPDLLFFDGSPRSEGEMSSLYSRLKEVGYGILPIELHLSDELALKRRLLQLEGGDSRSDAGTEKERIQTYHEITEPVLLLGQKHHSVDYKTLYIREETSPFEVALAINHLVVRKVLGAKEGFAIYCP
jgi:adenylate kinase family enzyme